MADVEFASELTVNDGVHIGFETVEPIGGIDSVIPHEWSFVDYEYEGEHLLKAFDWTGNPYDFSDDELRGFDLADYEMVTVEDDYIECRYYAVPETLCYTKQFVDVGDQWVYRTLEGAMHDSEVVGESAIRGRPSVTPRWDYEEELLRESVDAALGGTI